MVVVKFAVTAIVTAGAGDEYGCGENPMDRHVGSLAALVAPRVLLRYVDILECLVELEQIGAVTAVHAPPPQISPAKLGWGIWWSVGGVL